MTEDFKARLIAHAQIALDRAPRALSEAATQQYLILPFFQLLGYDPLNPDEIIPEAQASFSDKFRNRVDYAICQNKEPVIAVECKKAGSIAEGHRGELKGYFNALSTVKLGILTDGLVYELYSDTGAENMMDDEPFARIDLSEVAHERISDDGLDALMKLREGTFDPADVGADAKRKLHIAAYVAALEEGFREPSQALVKTLMDLARVEGRRTGRLVEEHTPIVAESLRVFFDKKLLERVGFADRQDLVRVSAPTPAAPQPPTPIVSGEEPPEKTGGGDTGIITTETELAVFDYVRTRLPFLIQRDEGLFAKLNDLFPVDYKTVFSVCYKQERKGKLFNFREGSAPQYRFDFPHTGEHVGTDDLPEIDTPLLAAFLKRVEELG